VSSSEVELIKRAQTGDSDAFCRLAQGYQRRIYLLALHYCRNPYDAEDLSQEVWLKAYRAVGSFRGESSFYTWLRQIMINSFLNHRRERTMMVGDEVTAVRMEELDVVDAAGPEHGRRAPGVEEEVHRRLLVEKVTQALGELTPQQRLIFLLKHREGMTYEEISQSVGCSTGTIKKSLFRAIIKLREHLGLEQAADFGAPAPDLNNGLSRV
jgi:RNA polymerase sigma-70 factor (ECF subfamily)